MTLDPTRPLAGSRTTDETEWMPDSPAPTSAVLERRRYQDLGGRVAKMHGEMET